jgi:hypothetical protein
MKNCTLIILTLLCFSSGAQVFRNSVGGNQSRGTASINLSNDDILLVGNSLNNPVGGEDVIISRLTHSGDTLWTNTYGGQGDEYGPSAIELADGSFIVSYYYRSLVTSNYYAGALRIDANGDLLWSKDIAYNVPESNGQYGVKLMLINNDIYFFKWSGDKLNVLELDMFGAVLNEQAYEYPNGTIQSISTSIDNDYVILLSESSSYNSSMVIDMDIVTGQQAIRAYDIGTATAGVEILNDGDFYYMMYSGVGFSSSSYMAKLAPNLDLEWSNYLFGNSGFTVVPISMINYNDTIYVSKGDLYQIDTAGNLLNIINANYININSMNQDAYGHLQLTGYFTPGGGSYACLYQLDSSFNYGGCTTFQKNPTSNFSVGAIEVVPTAIQTGTTSLATQTNLIFQFPNYDYIKYNLEVNLTSRNVLCKSACDGKGEAFVTGGVEPFNIVWDNSVIGAQNNNLCPGTYICMVQDQHGCSVVDSIMIDEPDTLTMSIGSGGAYCGGDTLNLSSSAVGGVLPYSYSWTAPNANGLDCDTCQNSQLVTTNDQFWTVSIADSNNCVVMDSVYIQTSEPIVTNVCVVSVDTSSTHNEVIWEKPSATNLESFNIYRDVVGTWYLIGNVHYDSLSQFVDTTFGIDPNATSYQYSISSIDTCGNESALSPHHQTMHLTQNQGTSGEINLIWDNYEGFGFIFYRILRDTGNNVFNVLDSVTATNTTYTDVAPPNAQTRYIIQVVLDQQCVSSRANHNTTRSNRTKPGVSGGSGTDVFEIDESSVSIYPNPTQHNMTIELQALNTGNAQIKILDMSGAI